MAKKMMKETVKCGECGAPMRLLESRQYGKFYGCVRWPECKGTHGAHQKTGNPMGIPANAETKKARIQAHEAFDTLWKNGGMTRKEAYKWIQDALPLLKEEAHISRFDKETCEKLISLVNILRRRASGEGREG